MTNKVDLNDSDFLQLINDKFSPAHAEPAQESFELIEVSRIGSAPQGDSRHPFSLLFRGSSTESPIQRVYQLEHSKLGQLELFLVPVGPDQTGVLYEAVFT